MSLKSRLQKLEEATKTEDYIVYEVWSDEDSVTKKQQAWTAYIAKGGRQAYEKTLFVQINKICRH
jgi:hypothetical protein